MKHAWLIGALMLSAAVVAGAVANAAATRPAQGAGDAQAREELLKMQGEWRSHLLEEEHRDGGKTMRLGTGEPVRIVVEGDQMRFWEQEKDKWLWIATIKIDAAAEPRRITLTRVSKGAPGEKDRAIVEQAIYRWSPDAARLELQSGLDEAAAPRKFLVADQPEKGLDGCIWSMFRPEPEKKED